jgi:hypothetical protein
MTQPSYAHFGECIYCEHGRNALNVLISHPKRPGLRHV